MSDDMERATQTFDYYGCNNEGTGCDCGETYCGNNNKEGDGGDKITVEGWQDRYWKNGETPVSECCLLL